MKMLKAVVVIVLVLGVAGWGAFRWFTAKTPVPRDSNYVIDLPAIRKLADSIPGPRGSRINHEVVAIGNLPRAAVFAGDAFTSHTMVHGVHQILYPRGSILIDAAMREETFESEMNLDGQGQFNPAGWDAVRRGLEEASLIVITHEHSDHIDGVLSHPNPSRLDGALRLTKEQFEDQSTQQKLASDRRGRITVVDYAALHAVAPGMVLIKAPGHTPGSQMVFVVLDDGSEWLFVGDVAWHMDAIRKLHYRPRLITDLFLGEDRDAVLHQFRALYDLDAKENVRIVVSHDAEQRRQLIASGRMGDHLEFP